MTGLMKSVGMVRKIVVGFRRSVCPGQWLGW